MHDDLIGMGAWLYASHMLDNDTSLILLIFTFLGYYFMWYFSLVCLLGCNILESDIVLTAQM